MAPRLTICIPTVNRASLVGRAIDSALAQTYPDIEIIVSNNGSTDGTRAVLDRYRDPRLRVLHRAETISVSAHANILLQSIQGEFVLALSDDDFIEPEFAARVMDLFDRFPRLSFVYTGCHLHYADVIVPARVGPEVETGPEFLAAFLAGRLDVCWCACVTRTEDLRKIGPVPEGIICGDMFFWTKLAAMGDVGCVADELSHYIWYRDQGTNISSSATVVEWTMEANTWAENILATCERELSPTSSFPLDALRRHKLEFVARSGATQFAWTALKGASRLSLLNSVPPLFRTLRRGKLKNWINVIGSIAAPRWLLRNRILADATRRARAANRPCLER